MHAASCRSRFPRNSSSGCFRIKGGTESAQLVPLSQTSEDLIEFEESADSEKDSIESPVFSFILLLFAVVQKFKLKRAAARQQQQPLGFDEAANAK